MKATTLRAQLLALPMCFLSDHAGSIMVDLADPAKGTLVATVTSGVGAMVLPITDEADEAAVAQWLGILAHWQRCLPSDAMAGLQDSMRHFMLDYLVPNHGPLGQQWGLGRQDFSGRPDSVIDGQGVNFATKRTPSNSVQVEAYLGGS